jgi:hypothetical protein
VKTYYDCESKFQLKNKKIYNLIILIYLYEKFKNNKFKKIIKNLKIIFLFSLNIHEKLFLKFYRLDHCIIIYKEMVNINIKKS